MEERKIDYWDEAEAEVLMHETMDDAIEAIIDQYDENGDMVPEVITIHGYAREAVNWEHQHPLENLLEQLDDNFGGEDATDPTPAMIEAEKSFLAVMAQEYKVWRCDSVVTNEINVAVWRSTHV